MIHLSFLFWILFSRERDLLLVPYTSSRVSVVQWPPFLLASKVQSFAKISAGYIHNDLPVLTFFFLLLLQDSYSNRNGKRLQGKFRC